MAKNQEPPEGWSLSVSTIEEGKSVWMKFDGRVSHETAAAIRKLLYPDEAEGGES